jgi:pimeloyl-ACP methyl ester carboxylesterase
MYQIMCFPPCQAPLHVEGWDEALHEIGRLSSEMVLAPQNAASLLKAVENLPVLVIAGAEDALVPLKSSQGMASKLLNSVSPSFKLKLSYPSYGLFSCQDSN